MDLANCSLMEITMACVGKVYLEDFSDSIKWTILGLMNRPGSYLESDIGGKLKIYSDEELKEPFKITCQQFLSITYGPAPHFKILF